MPASTGPTDEKVIRAAWGCERKAQAPGAATKQAVIVSGQRQYVFALLSSVSNLWAHTAFSPPADRWSLQAEEDKEKHRAPSPGP